jgi:hypothetical protein
MLLDAFVPTGLSDEIQVSRRKACKMLRVAFFVFGPFVAVVVVPMCEDVIATSMETFDEFGYRVSWLYLVSHLNANSHLHQSPWVQNFPWHVDIDLRSCDLIRVTG